MNAIVNASGAIASYSVTGRHRPPPVMTRSCCLYGRDTVPGTPKSLERLLHLTGQGHRRAVPLRTAGVPSYRLFHPPPTPPHAAVTVIASSTPKPLPPTLPSPPPPHHRRLRRCCRTLCQSLRGAHQKRRDDAFSGRRKLARLRRRWRRLKAAICLASAATDERAVREQRCECRE